MIKSFLLRNPISTYFGLAFLISWGSVFGFVAPKIIHDTPLQKLDGLLMFPIMICSTCLTGIALTFIAGGRAGLKQLFLKIIRWRVDIQWYVPAVLLPPVALTFTLSLLGHFSSDYSINIFPIGIMFGIPAGFLEEIGWMGYVFPKLQMKFSNLMSGVLLGILWALWHLPVIDFLGSASPHGKSLAFYFFSFAAVMIPMRVIITWLYVHTKSILICQLLHASSTGFLVMFSPINISPGQEAFWYLCYAGTLSIIVGFIVFFDARNLVTFNSRLV